MQEILEAVQQEGKELKYIRIRPHIFMSDSPAEKIMPHHSPHDKYQVPALPLRIFRLDIQYAVNNPHGVGPGCYGITDNIAYSNLQKKYEKTYAYCVRLLDRIEQTEGYYPGIPIAMVGVVGEEQFPSTDLTLPVTSGMIGMNGDK